MMRIMICSLATFLIYSLSFAQPNIEWQNCYGGSRNDGGAKMAKTFDGGYILAGSAYSNDGDITGSHKWADYWVVKIDNIGNIEWQKALGGSEYEAPRDVIQTKDGGYILAGQSESNDGDVSGHHGTPGINSDYWVVKLDKAGNILWQKSLGGTDHDVAYSIFETEDGGYFVGGITLSDDGDVSVNYGGADFWTVKLDSIGNIEWEKSYGGSMSEGASSMDQTKDGGYIAFGSRNNDYWVIKLSESGEVSWQNTYGGSGREQPGAIIQTRDSCFLIVGDSDSNDGDVTGNHGGQDFWVVKIDSLGNIIWQKTYGGSNGDNARAVNNTSDGGYIVAGFSSSTDGDLTDNHGFYDYWIIKIDTLGNIQWQKSLGGTAADTPDSVHETDGGGYIVSGETESIDGDVLNNHGGQDYWIVELNTSTSVSIEEIENNLLTIYPNPTQDFININLKNSYNVNIEITNMHGQVIYKKTSNNSFEKIDLTTHSKGLYFITLRSDNFFKTEKVIRH